MNGARPGSALTQFLPIAGLILVLFGIADAVAWLLLGTSFLPAPLCLVPLALGALIVRRIGIGPARHSRY